MATAKLDMEKLVSLCRRRGFVFQSSEIYGGINGFWDYGPLGVELKKNIKDAWWQDMVRNPPPGPDGDEVTMVGVDCSIIMNPKVWEASGHLKGFQDPMVECSKCKKRFRADNLWLVGFYDLDALFPGDVVASAGPIDNLLDRGIKPHLWFTVESKEEAVALALSNAQRRQLKGKDIHKAIQRLQLVGQYAGVLDPTEIACPICGEGRLGEARQFNLMYKTHHGAVEDDASVVYLRPETAQGIF